MHFHNLMKNHLTFQPSAKITTTTVCDRQAAAGGEGGDTLWMQAGSRGMEERRR